MKEIDGFITQAGLPEHLRPVVRRYTGRQDDDSRRAVAANPPDILLTNFMMLELLLARQDKLDETVIGNAKGLQFIVLDELHTYRGRQGADVAVLVRRLRDRCAEGHPPVCTVSSQARAECSPPSSARIGGSISMAADAPPPAPGWSRAG